MSFIVVRFVSARNLDRLSRSTLCLSSAPAPPLQNTPSSLYDYIEQTPSLLQHGLVLARIVPADVYQAHKGRKGPHGEVSRSVPPFLLLHLASARPPSALLPGAQADHTLLVVPLLSAAALSITTLYKSSLSTSKVRLVAPAHDRADTPPVSALVPPPTAPVSLSSLTPHPFRPPTARLLSRLLSLPVGRPPDDPARTVDRAGDNRRDGQPHDDRSGDGLG